MGSAKRCLFISHENDLHAHSVAKWLREDHRLGTEIVPANAVAGRHTVTFCDTGGGAHLDPDAYDLVWARRLRLAQKGCDDLDEEARAFVNAECRAAWEGLLWAATRPVIVNPLIADQRANNKLWQMRMARHLGFAMPLTYCGNDPDAIRAFADCLDGRVIVKKLQGINSFTPLTLDATEEVLADTDALSAAPLLVQERIEAACHYRVNVFGPQVRAFRIVSDALDWRPGAGQGATAVRLAPRFAGRCRDFVTEAGLYYGVIDLIQDRCGRIHFLECNPQGQFLFMECQSGLPISRDFAAFLAVVLGRSERKAA